MRSARETGVPRVGDYVPGAYLLTDFHHNPAFLQVAIMPERSVVVSNQHVVIETIVIDACAAFVGIILDADDNTAARGVDQRALGHIPINGVLVGAGMAELSVVGLRDFKLVARRIRQLVDNRIVVTRAVASQFVIIGVGVFPFGPFVYG